MPCSTFSYVGLVLQQHSAGWSTPQLPVPQELVAIADSFVDLHQARHNEKSWTLPEVNAKLAEAQTTFQSWTKIQGSSVADEYLLSLMIGK
jgi:hypothetical protein